MENYIYIIAPTLGWIAAQGLKVFIDLRNDGMQWRDTWASGGMPSSHSAGITALTSVIGLENGFDSPLFGLALAVMVVILYDSVGVRRTSGDNALAIREIKRKLNKNLDVSTRQQVHVAKGHTPAEVIGGVVLGILIGVILTALL